MLPLHCNNFELKQLYTNDKAGTRVKANLNFKK